MIIRLPISSVLPFCQRVLPDIARGQQGGGGGVLSYTCYIAIRPVLVRSSVSVLAIFSSNREWFLRSRLELDMFTEEAIFRHYR